MAQAGAGGGGPGPPGLEGLLGFLRPAFVTLVISSVFTSGSLQVFVCRSNMFPLVHLSPVMPFLSLCSLVLYSCLFPPAPSPSLLWATLSVSCTPGPPLSLPLSTARGGSYPAPPVSSLAKLGYTEPRPHPRSGLSHPPSPSTRHGQVWWLMARPGPDREPPPLGLATCPQPL